MASLHALRTSHNRLNLLPRRVAAVTLLLCLLSTSTPGAPRTIVAVVHESRISFAFWFNASGLKKLIQSRTPTAITRERQIDRDAQVARLQILPGDISIDITERVRFTAVAFNSTGDAVGGVKVAWSAQAALPTQRIRLSPLGQFEPVTPGVFTITAKGAGKSARATVTVRPGTAPNLRLPPINTRQVSSRDTASVRIASAKTKESRVARAQIGNAATTRRAHASSAIAPEPMPQGGGGWDNTNYYSADDPENRVGDPPGATMDGGAGSGNFQFAAPIYSAPGRGINISLGLAYNSRLWNKAGTQISYDNDHGWPAPGFNLGFGKLLGMGVYNGCMIVDANGTRHGYTGTISFYNWGTYGVMHTTDGSFIDYTYWTGTNGIITWAQAKLANGTIINYGAYSQAGGGVFPTSIEDANGNFIVITYVNNSGPRIQTVTDSLGRVISFHYDANNLLTAITAPTIGGTTRTAVRLHYKQLPLNYSFSNLTPSVRDPNPWVVDGIYYPATHTGYWLGDADAYSTYGMLRKVVEERDMNFSDSPLTEMGTVYEGSVTRRESYNYPAYVGDASGTQSSNLTDAPSYTSAIEEWSRDGTNFDSATTGYEVFENASPRTTTVTLPNGTKSKQYSYNAPGQWNDGLVFEDRTFTTDEENPLQKSTSSWEQGAYNSPRPTRVEKFDERGQKTASAFSYGSVYNQIIEVRDYDYGGINVLRYTRTSYQNSVNYTGTCYSTGCFGRHIFNLPLTVEIYEADGVTRVSRTEYQYDGQALAAAPNVVMHNQAYNPYADAEGYCYWDTDWNDPDCSSSCLEWNWNCDGYCGQIWVCPYDASTDYRGSVTQVTTYADALNLTGAVTETRRYDVTGNLVTASTSCCEQTSFSYTLDYQYAYPQSTTRGSATDAYAQITTTGGYDFNTGLATSATDANGRPSSTEYNPDTLRVNKVTSPTGAHTDYTYNDVMMKVVATTFTAGGTVADQNVKFLNGRGQVRQEQARAPDEGGSEKWDCVDSTFDAMGQTIKQTGAHRCGTSAPNPTLFLFDSLGRTTKVIAPDYTQPDGSDGSASETFYNEPARPDVASAEPGETMRVRDAWGRERWGRTDAKGNLVEVVEPNPNGNGSVNTGGLVTSYSYSALGNLTQITQGDQTRAFKYDSFGRLTAQRLAEISATLNEAGTYLGVGGPSAQWGDVFTYDERSNLTSRTDARGVKTVYTYNNDPLNRLQSVSWDMSGFGDTANSILPAATVNYSYRTKSGPTDAKDITQLAGLTTVGFSTESYVFDAEGRVSSKTLTLTSRSDYPFVTNYDYDSLDRVTDVRYPAQYPSLVRKVVHHDYDIASRLSGLTYDGQSFASNIVYNASSQTTSLNVGVGTNQVTENYSYNLQTGLLDNQTVTRGATTLLNLSYDYANASGKRTGQLTKILNNQNNNKDRAYSYDALGRLVQATGGPASSPLWTQNYSYDRYGNRTSVTASGNSASNRPTHDAPLVARASRSDAQAEAITQPSLPKVDLPTDLLARNSTVEVPPFLRDDFQPISDSPPKLFSAKSSRLNVSALSPQSGATKIAFATNRDGSNQIYLMNTDGSGQARLTNNQSNDESPRWSPNNSRIAFQSDRDNPFCQVYDIYAMNADGSAQARLTFDPLDDSAPVWSPDGTKIAFQSFRNGVNYQIYVMNADGSSQTNISNGSFNDTQPSWSPDGTKIAFASDRDHAGYPSVYVMGSTGANQTRLTFNATPYSDEQPAWSPDGAKLAFVSTRDSTIDSWTETDDYEIPEDDGQTFPRTRVNVNKEVYVMNADGSAQARLTNSLENDESPSWSADGTKIVFRSDRERENFDPVPQVWIMNSDGSTQAVLLNDECGDYSPNWQHASNNLSPTVSITAPTNGQGFTAPVNITVAASASDSDGFVTRVDFYNGGNLIGAATSAPFTISWNNVTAGSYSLTAKATDNAGAQITSPAVNITVNAAPSVSVDSPVNGATFTAPANITISAGASDSDGTISSVEFYQGTTLIGTDTAAPYSVNWNNVGSGSYSLVAKATDNNGATNISGAVNITVNSNGAPSVNITGPANGASFTAPANITITANATDSDGTINRVDFYNGTNLIGSDTTVPYSAQWNSVAAGSYSLTAKAIDNGSSEATSAPVSITVNPASVPIPLDGHASLSYDTGSNRITSAGFAYDAAGNQTQVTRIDGSLQRFQYDAANRLIYVRDGSNNVLTFNTYGDSNARVIAEENGVRTYYPWDGISEYFESGNSTTPIWSKSHVYFGNRLLSTLTPNAAGGEAIQFHHPDRLGTRIVSDPQTGGFFEQQTLPFGTALDESPPPGGIFGSTNRRFTSYDRSAIQGLDYAVNRHFDPQQGRFTQVDPVGMRSSNRAIPQTLNLYAYCGNDPINQVDADGLFWGKLWRFIKKALQIINAVVLTVVAILSPNPESIYQAISAWVDVFGGWDRILPKSRWLRYLPAHINASSGPVIQARGTPPWNPNGPPFFSFQDQGPTYRCQNPPNCQNDIPALPPEIVNIPIPRSIWSRIWGGLRTVAGGITVATALGASYYQRYDAWVGRQMSRFERRMAENSRIAVIGHYSNGEPIYLGVPVSGGLRTVGPQYSLRTLMKMEADPLFHGFPTLVEQQVLQYGTRQVISPNYVQYTLRGYVNGRAGTYEIGINPATNEITHRFFNPR